MYVSFDSIRNLTKGKKKKGTFIGTNTTKIELRVYLCICDQKISIFSTEMVVVGRYFINGVKGLETF